MISLLWAAVISVGLVAVTAFGLVLVLARRLRTVTERVEMYLPVSEGRLPDPGTPVPEFEVTALDGSLVSQRDLAGADRILAFLTTDCPSCRDQVPALNNLDSDAWLQPIVVVIGPPAERSDMVRVLVPGAIVVEQNNDDRLVQAFDIHEFPAILLVRFGVIQTAAHGVASLLQQARQPAST
jgi:hypothetical protein